VTATEKAEGYLYDVDLTGATAIVMGAEDKGVSDPIRKLANAEAKIPMAGNIGSLNVSAAASVILYEAVRQRITK
jgi:23S rRNA (guanosine2251-2'-O)-methyltransferase